MSRQDQPAVLVQLPDARFLKTSGAAISGAALLSAISSRGYAAENNTIKIALVGCGGRGTGAAANALSTSGPTKLWAMADVFENRLQRSLQDLSKQFEKQVDVPKERQFVGMDGYRKAIDALEPGSVVLLATPPAFRPMHLEYAVQKGMQRLHGEIVRGRCPRRSPRAEGRRRGREEKPQDRRRADEPPLQTAGRRGPANPRRRDRRGRHLLGLSRA